MIEEIHVVRSDNTDFIRLFTIILSIDSAYHPVDLSNQIHSDTL